VRTLSRPGGWGLILGPLLAFWALSPAWAQTGGEEPADPVGTVTAGEAVPGPDENGDAAAELDPEQAYLALLGALRESSFPEKEDIVVALTETGHPNVEAALLALLEDRVYFMDDDEQKVYLTSSAEAGANDLYELIDPVTLEPTGTADAYDLIKVRTNNGLRRFVRTTSARYSLSSPRVAVRANAVRNMTRSLDEETIAILREHESVETSERVLNEIETAIALYALDSEDAGERLGAVEVLGGSLNQDVRNRLALMADESGDPAFVEPDARVRAAAADAVRTIELWRTFYSGFEMLFFGLSLGSVLVLVAIGLAITFGVMGVINMAHGELMMLGAYTTYVVQTAMPNHVGLSILLAIPAAFMVAGGTGVLIERTIIRFLYGRPLETLLATFGVSLILQQTVRSTFTALNRSVRTPEWMSGTLRINDALGITYNRLYIVVFTLIVFAVLVAVLKKTRLGLDIRAVSQNRAMARAMGVRSSRVDAMTFGLGAGIAGVAGVALSQLTNVGPNLGQSYIIDSFMVVVFGGVGNLWGALVGGMSMGVVNILLEPFAGAVLAKILVLVALILFIQVRPRGMFPQTGRSAEN
jgi:urea transport system permease protein